MKRLVITWALAVTLFGLASAAEAVQPAKQKQAAEPFVSIITDRDKVDLGTILFPGTYDVPAALTLEVDSNYMHGPITISATELKHRKGASISPEHISIKTPSTGGFITMEKPVVISKPTTGPHKIVLDLKVKTDFINPAGEYTGTFIFTIIPPL